MENLGIEKHVVVSDLSKFKAITSGCLKANASCIIAIQNVIEHFGRDRLNRIHCFVNDKVNVGKINSVI